MFKKFIVGIALITMLAPAGVWAMDNEEERKERMEDSHELFFDIKEIKEFELREQEVKQVLSMKGLTPDQRRALLSPATQEWIDQELFNIWSYFNWKKLFSLGANVHVKNAQGESLLEITVKNRDLMGIEYLLKHGATVDEQMRVGIEQLRLNEALIDAIREKRKDEVMALLAAGAEVNYADMYGTRPLDVASNYGDSEIVELLLNKGVEVNRFETSQVISQPLWNALLSENVDVVKTLIMAGAQIETECDFECAILKVKTRENSYEGKLRKIYMDYPIAGPIAQAIIYAIAMRDMLEAQDWSFEDIQKDGNCNFHLPIPGLPGLVGDYADFYDKELDYYPLNKGSECDSIVALVGDYVDSEIGSEYLSLNRIMKREIERRRRRREAGQPSVIRVERPVIDVQDVEEEEETKEAAAAVSYNSMAQGSEENAQQVACFNCTLLNSAGQSMCRTCGA